MTGVLLSGDADTASLRKARGAFFTPPALCKFLAEWAIRGGSDRVLEPSSGEAAFLLAAAERLKALGASAVSLRGIELHESSAHAAERRLEDAGFHVRVDVADFFTVPADPVHDAVIGNPPYVRYQDFSGDQRDRARLAALAGGVRLTGLASSWAAFTVHAARFLRPGGRLALVLPAELLSVNYAGEVRRWLMRRFGRVRLVVFDERVFPGVLEEVVLLLAEGEGSTEHCELQQVRDVEELVVSEPVLTRWRPSVPTGKWTEALLAPAELLAFSEATGHSGISLLEEWGDTTLGAVTGNNKFFALSSAEAALWAIPREDLLPLSPPGSRHLRSLSFDHASWATLEARGSKVWLFRPPGPLSNESAAYVAEGERLNVDQAYKCRVRQPWWRTPVVAPADLLVTCMNADTPRLTANLAGVHHLNSVHGLYLRPELRSIGVALLPIASLNSMTLVGAETVGRAYGGGLLKLEPREADLLPVPSAELLRSRSEELEALRPAIDQRLAAGDLLAAVRLVDTVLLIQGIGLGREAVSVLENTYISLAARRAARGRPVPVPVPSASVH